MLFNHYYFNSFHFIWFCLFLYFIFFFGMQRKKRAMLDWTIAPNTKWCGSGQTANKYNDLGGASKADKCCRRHDHCKFSIHGVTTKWRLFNYLPFTISHCNCDSRLVRFICWQILIGTFQSNLKIGEELRFVFLFFRNYGWWCPYILDRINHLTKNNSNLCPITDTFCIRPIVFLIVFLFLF